MNEHSWMTVPAGVLGQGGTDVRRGTGLPVARPRVGAAAPSTPCGEFAIQGDRTAHHGTTHASTTHDGTTLGFQSSSRPPS